MNIHVHVYAGQNVPQFWHRHIYKVWHDGKVSVSCVRINFMCDAAAAIYSTSIRKAPPPMYMYNHACIYALYVCSTKDSSINLLIENAF